MVCLPFFEFFFFFFSIFTAVEKITPVRFVWDLKYVHEKNIQFIILVSRKKVYNR